MQQTPVPPTPPAADNDILSWVIAGAALLIIVTIAYYVISFLRNKITEDPDNAPAQKLSELEQLKSTAYMTDEERKRLNSAAVAGKLPGTGELDPELAEFRKIRKLREANQPPQDSPTFEEIKDKPQQ